MELGFVSRCRSLTRVKNGRLHMIDTVAVDMFVVATATFWLLYTVIVLGHDRTSRSPRIRRRHGSHVKTKPCRGIRRLDIC